MTAENALDRKLVAEYLTKWANALAAWPAFRFRLDLINHWLNG